MSPARMAWRPLRWPAVPFYRDFARVGLPAGLYVMIDLGSLLVLLMGFTPITKEPSWKQSQLLPLLLPGAEWMHGKLPDWSVPETDSRNGASAGDNGEVGMLPAPLLEGAVLQAIGSAKEHLSPQPPVDAGPAGQEPANLESSEDAAVQVEPAEHRPTGQARPKSQ